MATLRLGAALLAVLAMLGPNTARADDAPICPRAGAEAVACFVNATRASLGLRPLQEHPALATSSQRYAERLSREDFFDHVAPDGEEPADRLLRSGYGSRRSDRPWIGGEALGLGTGRLGTPESIVLGWLNSPSHLALIRDPRYRDIGVGIAPIEGGSVYVLHVGQRKIRRNRSGRR